MGLLRLFLAHDQTVLGGKQHVGSAGALAALRMTAFVKGYESTSSQCATQQAGQYTTSAGHIVILVRCSCDGHEVIGTHTHTHTATLRTRFDKKHTCFCDTKNQRS